ncbi:MAG TPA: hypothetical protein VGQ39_22995 [Pyrinomonadaceae bacterium]|jgi:DNA-directed RNA polymerase specialized sigma24 family protein|nr:hypothetical protein [Pyrinomonadaceae bacterium]
MSKLYSSRTELKKNRTLDADSFNRLLAWLDCGVNSEGQKYLEIRKRLVTYFYRKNCSAPDDLADETLNRVARRIQEEGFTKDEKPERYCYIVARFVFMESLREGQRVRSLQHELARQGSSSTHSETDDGREKMLACMQQCIQQLGAAKRELILGYYTGEQRQKVENRKRLASSLKVTTNGLSIRACRIRDELESCVRKCMRMK